MTAQSDSITPTGKPLEWRRFRFPRDLIRFGALLLVLVFLVWTTEYLGIPLERFITMWPKLFGVFADRYYPPDIEYVLERNYLASVVDTIQMAYLGMLFGVLAAIPLAWFASFNMSPSRRFVYPAARLVLMGARAVHETIWTILFVTILGFGMLAGVLALTVFCIGFAGKLYAEEIEAIDPGPVEALRATGANQIQVMIYGVWPQVRVAFTGIAIYT
ncbi:MAG: phosphonate ABC transporter, permease protein PhnE, partial [Gammaproteobacteria bacterium]|nr:phosphonate ABC transporter, permease protein PhnE [Gammaproteobacteria bacterium]